jgi:peroxiredoxin
MAFQAIVFIHCLERSALNGFDPVWLGPLVAAAAFPTFMTWTIASDAARTGESLPTLLVVSSAGVLVALAGAAFAPHGEVVLPLGYALSSLGAQFLYVFWYSRFDRTPSRVLRVGDSLPELVLEDEEGGTLSTKALLGHPAVLLFYRGNWCPLCMAQIRELAGEYRELAARGAKVLLVSPQPHEQTRALAARFDVPFLFLVDPGGRVARDLEIAHEAGVPLGIPGYGRDTVFPTVIVVDAEGKILSLDETDNHRVRPEPSTFLTALDATNRRERSPRPEAIDPTRPGSAS